MWWCYSDADDDGIDCWDISDDGNGVDDVRGEQMMPGLLDLPKGCTISKMQFMLVMIEKMIYDNYSDSLGENILTISGRVSIIHKNDVNKPSTLGMLDCYMWQKFQISKRIEWHSLSFICRQYNDSFIGIPA